MYYYKEHRMCVCVCERGWTAVMICVLRSAQERCGVNWRWNDSLSRWASAFAVCTMCVHMCLWCSEAWMRVVIIIVIFSMFFFRLFVSLVSTEYAVKATARRFSVQLKSKQCAVVAAAATPTSMRLEKNSKCKTISRDEKNIKRAMQTLWTQHTELCS